MLTSIPDLLKTIIPNQRRIDAQQAKQELASNKGLLIDVREPAEHAAKAAAWRDQHPAWLTRNEVNGA